MTTKNNKKNIIFNMLFVAVIVANIIMFSMFLVSAKFNDSSGFNSDVGDIISDYAPTDSSTNDNEEPNSEDTYELTYCEPTEDAGDRCMVNVEPVQCYTKVENKVDTYVEKSKENIDENVFYNISNNDPSENTDDDYDENIDNECEEIYDNPCSTQKLYTAGEFKYLGVLYAYGWRWTWYSERVLPGGGLDIPGRHNDENGYVCDENDFICVASSVLNKGEVVKTPLGKLGKVYDCGCNLDTIDVYVSW